MTRLVVTDQWFGNTRHEELLARQRGVEFAGHQCEPGALGGIPSFRSTVVGLIGAGRIAQEPAGRLAPFGFTILGHDPYARPVEALQRLATEEAGRALAGEPLRCRVA